MEDLSKILDFVGKYSWAVSGTTAILLFFPDSTLEGMDLLEFVVSYKGFLWFLFILSSVLYIGFVAKSIFHLLLKQYLKRVEKRKIAAQHKKSKEAIKGRLKNLSDGERYILIYCLVTGTQSFRANISDPFMSALYNKGFLKRGGGTIIDCNYLIKDIVWEVICDEEELVLESFDVENSESISFLRSFMSKRTGFQM